MEGTPYRSFFLEPTDTLHRQYEALRAVFVEQRPMQEAAQQFGYRYDTMRALVSRFRRQCETEQLPPFLPGRNGDGPPADSRANPRPPRKDPPRPIVVTSTSLRDDSCAAASPASSSSCHGWSSSASTDSSPKPALPALRWSPLSGRCSAC